MVSGGPIPLLEVGVGDSITFTATYTITPADFAAGFVENTAEATGAAVDENGDPVYGPGGEELTATDTSDTGTTPDGDTVVDPAGEETETFDAATQPDGDLTNDPTVTALPGNPTPRVSIVKSVASVADTNGDGLLGEGDTVTYSFAVTNTGNVRLGDVTVTDNLATVSGGPISLEIGQTDTTTFTATSVITADQAANGAAENSASADAVGVNSLGDPLIDPATGLPRTTSDVSDAGTEPEITQDGGIAAYADPAGNETPDAAGATDTDPTNDPTVLFLPMPEIAVVKSVAGVTDTNGNGFTDEGDVVSYTFSVENTGNTDLVDVVITDGLAGVVVTGNPIASLAQGETNATQVTATYALTAADIIAGGVENSAAGEAVAVGADGDVLADPFNPGAPLTVTDTSDAGTTPDGAAIDAPEATESEDFAGATDTDPGNDPTVFLLQPEPLIEVVKSITGFIDATPPAAGEAAVLEAGDSVIYSFTVTNVGNVALGAVDVFDGLGTVTGGTISLAIGETNSTAFEMVYELTRVISLRVLSKTLPLRSVMRLMSMVILSLTRPPTPPSRRPTYPMREPSRELDANGDPIVVTDPETVESPDINGATDTDPTNDPTVLLLPQPQITLVKTASNVLDTNNDGLFGGEDDEVIYAFTVTNTGNVDLQNVQISDDTAVVTGGPIDLAVGEGDSVTFTATYIVTADDVANGFLENTATATGDAVNANGDPLNDINGDPISTSDVSDTGSNPDVSPVVDPENTETADAAGATDGDATNDPTVTLIPSNPLPRIEVVKSIASVTDNGDGVIGEGDFVNYVFTVTNTGNINLADVTIADDLVAVSGGPIDLGLGEENSTEFTAQYTLTAADVAAGGVENTATATGNAVNSNGDPITEPNGGPQLTASDVSDAGSEPQPTATGLIEAIDDPAGNETPDLAGGTDTDPTNDPTVLFIPTPSLEVVKSIASAPDSNNDGTFGGIGDTLFYSFTVTNTGNVDLADVTLLDPTADVVGGPIPLLEVGGVDTATFTASYVVTANDVNVVGYVENTATAQGTATGPGWRPDRRSCEPGFTDCCDRYFGHRHGSCGRCDCGCSRYRNSGWGRGHRW